MIKLNDKERKIIELKAQGKTVKQIARALTTSRAYAEQIIHGLYKKTGCSNAGSLVSWGYTTGYLEINREILPTKKEDAA